MHEEKKTCVALKGGTAGIDIIKCPDIIYPLGRKPKEQILFTDKNFIEDLDLEKFINFIKFYAERDDYYIKGVRFNDEKCAILATKHIAASVITDLNIDKKTTQYRQKAFSALLSNDELRNKVGNVVKSLQTFREYLTKAYTGKSEPDKAQILNFLRYHHSIMNAYLSIENIDAIESGPLKDIASYFKELKNSPEFKKLDEGLEKISGVNSVSARIEVCGFEAGKIKIESCSDEKVEVDINYYNQFDRDTLNKSDTPLDIVMENYFINILGDAIETNAPHLFELAGLFDKLDFYVSFSNYFAEQKQKGFDVVMPIILDKEERKMIVKNVKHPLIKEAKESPEKVIPNDIQYNVDENIFLITGPNSGGKSTHVQAVGLTQVMAQVGFPVFTTKAEISMVDGIYTHFIVPTDIESGAGQFENDLNRSKEIFQNATPFSLVLVDEPGKGTSVDEGSKMSLEIIKGYHRLGCPTYFTSHMHDVATEIEKGICPAAKNLSVGCEVDKNGNITKYTYKIIPGPAGKSYGAETVRKVGLTSKNILDIILDKARKRGYEDLLRTK